MQIVLICAHDYGSVGFAAKWIEGHHAPQRRYEIRNGQVMLDNGLAEDILHHDAEELLKNPLYRMPTPAEQEAWTKERNQAMTAQEQEEEQELAAFTQQVQRVNGDGDAIFAEQEAEKPDAPPAVQKRRYHRKQH